MRESVTLYSSRAFYHFWYFPLTSPLSLFDGASSPFLGDIRICPPPLLTCEWSEICNVSHFPPLPLFACAWSSVRGVSHHLLPSVHDCYFECLEVIWYSFRILLYVSTKFLCLLIASATASSVGIF